MKISTGGIGTVATAQGFNAKSAFPYQWAWDATKESDPVARTGNPVAGVAFSNLVGGDASAVDTGVKFTKIEVGGVGETLYADFNDGPDRALGISGTLDKVDTHSARYMHIIIDFTDAGTMSNFLIGGSSADISVFEMYWFSASTGNAYKGVKAQSQFNLGSSKVLVFDMIGGVRADYDPLVVVGSTAIGSWGSMTVADAPIKLEFYSEVAQDYDGTGTPTSYIFNGMVLADRILSASDLGSLPVDISKARS